MRRIDTLERLDGQIKFMTNWSGSPRINAVIIDPDEYDIIFKEFRSHPDTTRCNLLYNETAKEKEYPFNFVYHGMTICRAKPFSEKELARMTNPEKRHTPGGIIL